MHKSVAGSQDGWEKGWVDESKPSTAWVLFYRGHVAKLWNLKAIWWCLLPQCFKRIFWSGFQRLKLERFSKYNNIFNFSLKSCKCSCNPRSMPHTLAISMSWGGYLPLQTGCALALPRARECRLLHPSTYLLCTLYTEQAASLRHGVLLF